MHYKILQREDISDFIPLSTIQEQVRSFDPHDELLLAEYREAAISYAEMYMNRVLAKSVVITTVPIYCKSILLPLGDVSKILSITATHNRDTVTVENYNLNTVSNIVTIPTDYRNCQEFMITFEVGYEVGSIPKTIEIGVLKLLSTWFESREDLSFGVSVAQVPFNHLNCFNLFRLQPH